MTRRRGVSRATMGLVVLGALLLFAAAAEAGSKVGGVTRLKGQCSGELDGRPAALAMRSDIFQEQIVSTKAAARLQITFEDTTLLTLGEKARLTIDRFVYDPKRSRIRFAVTGAMRFVSAASKPAGARITVETPVATIGVRGTDFWAGPIDGQYGVLLLRGRVVVANPAGTAVLDEPGEGVNIAGPGAAPGPVTQWPRQKVRRALAAVAF